MRSLKENFHTWTHRQGVGGVKKLNNALQGHDVGETLRGDTFDRAWPFRILIFPQRKGRFPEHGSMIKETES